MADEHGGCCCNHADQHDTQNRGDVAVQKPQIQSVADKGGCCTEARDAEPTRSEVSNPSHRAPVTSPS